MNTYTIRQAKDHLHRRGINISPHQLRRLLVEQGYIKRTEHGYQVINPDRMGAFIITHTGQHHKRTEGGSTITGHHTSVRLTDRGLNWIRAFITRVYPAAA